MSDDVIIRVENLGKKYSIRHQRDGGYKTLREALTGRAKSLFHRPNGQKIPASNLSVSDSQRVSVSSKEDFWALKDVSFEVKRGEVVGIIGRNGAGKSTLLKILSRITEPTEGRVRIKGRVASLLEVGTGFHPELTGRENIFLNGAILGMTKAEIKNKFDEIVAFAETEKFLDTPVKRYSSGMYVRLAFAVAAHLEPEILVVDEVLAVGDAEFQKKCLGKMDDVAHQQGRTVLFVSHNMAAISRLCRRVLWLDRASLVCDERQTVVTARYLASFGAASGKREWADGFSNTGVDELKFLSVAITDTHGDRIGNVDYNQAFRVEIVYRVYVQLPFCRIGFLLSSADGSPVLEVYDVDDHCQGLKTPGTYVLRCEVPGQLFNAGIYLVSVNAGMPPLKNLAFLENVLELTVHDYSSATAAMGLPRSGVIRPKTTWTIENL